MVGPLGDGKFYCRGKHYGYCDRRSGTCFCNQGYQGVDCFSCTPTHYRDGSLCHPKKSCPNDCSGAGTCHYNNGTCTCQPHRTGSDCSRLFCRDLDASGMCTDCSFVETPNKELQQPSAEGALCTRCVDGWFVNRTANACYRCSSWDPRCTACDESGCLECGDPLLLSIRRSGQRAQDPYLPHDELTRELSREMPFGTQSPYMFDEAEPFRLSGRPSDDPLHGRAKRCWQMVDETRLTLEYTGAANGPTYGDRSNGNPYNDASSAPFGWHCPVGLASTNGPQYPAGSSGHAHPWAHSSNHTEHAYTYSRHGRRGEWCCESVGCPSPQRRGWAADVEYSTVDGYYSGATNEEEQPHFDPTWGCAEWSVSHVVCGHVGTFAFSSPTYAVVESAGHVFITIRRTGGGLGRAEVGYTLAHGSTSSADVSPSVYYAASDEQRVVFEEGVVSMSVLLTVHDDREREEDETCVLRLTEPRALPSADDNDASVGAAPVLGPTSEAVLTIMDDDTPMTTAGLSFATAATNTTSLYEDEAAGGQQVTWSSNGLVETMAGEEAGFVVHAVSSSGIQQSRGGDRWVVELRNRPPPPMVDPAYAHPHVPVPGMAQATSGVAQELPYASVLRGELDFSSARIPVIRGRRGGLYGGGGVYGDQGWIADESDMRHGTDPDAHHPFNVGSGTMDDATHANYSSSGSGGMEGGADERLQQQATLGYTDWVDRHDGSYAMRWRLDQQGNYSLSVRQAVQYGLHAEYFDDGFLEGAPVLTRVDRLLNFSWGTGRVTPRARDFVGARWSGFIEGPLSGVVTLVLDADEHARLWVDGELLIDRWEPGTRCGVAEAEVVMRRLELHAVTVEWRELRGDAHVQLGWKWPGLPSLYSPHPIPSARLYHAHHIQGSPFPINVRASWTSAINSVSRGQGLWTSVAGTSAHFETFPRDRFDNQQQYDGTNGVATPFMSRGGVRADSLDRFEAHAELVEWDPSGDQGGGNWRGQGPHDVVVHVTHHAASPRTSTAGAGATGAAAGGSAYGAEYGGYGGGNGHGTGSTGGGTSFESSAYGAGGYGYGGMGDFDEGHPCHGVVANATGGANGGDGGYRINAGTAQTQRYECARGVTGDRHYRHRFVAVYSPTVSGRYLLTVRHRRAKDGVLEHTFGSPFPVHVLPAHTSAMASRTWSVDGPQLANAAGAFNGTGSNAAYETDYIRHRRGQSTGGGASYNSLGGWQEGGDAEVMVGGYPGLHHGRSGVLGLLRVQAHDSHRNLRQLGGDRVEVHAYHTTDGARLTDTYDPSVDGDPLTDDYAARAALSEGGQMAPTPKVVVGTVVDNGDGTYDASYRPLLTGKYRVAVTMDGVHVHDSPYEEITVVPAQLAPRSCPAWGPGLKGAISEVATNFSVEARDAFNNYIPGDVASLLNGSLELTATLTGTKVAADGHTDEFGSPSAYTLPVVAIGGPGSDSCTYAKGYYTCEYTPTGAGRHILAVRLRGRHVRGSPFTVSILPGEANATTSTVHGVGLRRARAGEGASFYLQAKDDSRNKKRSKQSVSKEHDRFDDVITANLTYVRGTVVGCNGLRSPPTDRAVTEEEASSEFAVTRVHCEVSYTANGRYTLRYTPSYRGYYRLAVFLNGAMVHQSAVGREVYVASAEVDWGSSALSWVGLAKGTAGELSVVKVDLHDRFGNHLDVGGAQLVPRYVHLGGHAVAREGTEELRPHPHARGHASTAETNAGPDAQNAYDDWGGGPTGFGPGGTTRQRTITAATYPGATGTFAAGAGMAQLGGASNRRLGLHGELNATVVASYYDYGNGSYDISYTPLRAGEWRAEVFGWQAGGLNATFFDNPSVQELPYYQGDRNNDDTARTHSTLASHFSSSNSAASTDAYTAHTTGLTAAERAASLQALHLEGAGDGPAVDGAGRTLQPGEGLNNKYFAVSRSSLVLRRVDPSIDFDWGSAAPSITDVALAGTNAGAWQELTVPGKAHGSQPQSGLANVYNIHSAADYRNIDPAQEGMALDDATQLEAEEGTHVTSRTGAADGADVGVGSASAAQAGLRLPRDRWAAVWEGQLQPQHSENFTFHLSADDGGRLFVGGALLVDTWRPIQRAEGAEGVNIDGTHRWRPVLAEAGRDGGQWSLTSAGSAVLRAGEYYDLRVEYYEVEGDAAVKLEWESASTPRQVVPPNALYRLLPVPANVPGTGWAGDGAGDAKAAAWIDYGVQAVSVVAPREAAHSQCVADGEGLQEATSGQSSSFTVRARDTFDNQRLLGGDSFRVVGEGVGANRYEGNVTDLGDGTYRVTYTPTAAGWYSMAVSLQPQQHPTRHAPRVAAHRDSSAYEVQRSLLHSHIKGSPFRVRVQPGRTHAPACTVVGLGLIASVAGARAAFTIQSKDEQGNNIEITDEHERVGNRPVDHWMVALKRVPTVGESEGEAAREAEVGGSAVARSLAGSSGGMYESEYTAVVAGRYSLSVTLDGVHAMGSPFKPMVSPDVAYAPNCEVLFSSGTSSNPLTVEYTDSPQGVEVSATSLSTSPQQGVREGANYALLHATAAQAGSFTVQARDRWGNRLNEGGDGGASFVARIYGPQQQAVRVETLSTFAWDRQLLQEAHPRYAAESMGGLFVGQFVIGYNYSGTAGTASKEAAVAEGGGGNERQEELTKVVNSGDSGGNEGEYFSDPHTDSEPGGQDEWTWSATGKMYELSVALANTAPGGESGYSGGGLIAHYFSNQYWRGEAALVTVDSSIAFDWGHGAIIPAPVQVGGAEYSSNTVPGQRPRPRSFGVDHVSVRWSGLVQAEYSEEYSFKAVLDSDDALRVTIAGYTIIDTVSGEGNSAPGSQAHLHGALLVLHSRPIALTEGVLVEIVVEYREGEGNALVALYWSSDRLAEEIVPPSLLFPGSSAIKGSPWPINVTL
jgi:hypothetical protein